MKIFGSGSKKEFHQVEQHLPARPPQLVTRYPHLSARKEKIMCPETKQTQTQLPHFSCLLPARCGRNPDFFSAHVNVSNPETTKKERKKGQESFLPIVSFLSVFFRGRPRGRRVDSSPCRWLVRVTHAALTNALPRAIHRRPGGPTFPKVGFRFYGHRIGFPS